MRDNEKAPLVLEKGKFNQRCNRTACDTGLPAVWWNFSTKKFYCERCAEWLNEDPFNKKDAMELFGHDLLKKAESENQYSE